MGAIYVTAAIRNPADLEREWEGLFLVDTGATDCMVPRKYLEAIGLMPKGQRTWAYLPTAAITRRTSLPRTLSSWER